ncbi:MAG: hypothetical protein QE263_10135 [Vampirovibrionales bacterium]|nr:hypothetical protein [Vampirovibrionales bacterium]
MDAIKNATSAAQLNALSLKANNTDETQEAAVVGKSPAAEAAKKGYALQEFSGVAPQISDKARLLSQAVMFAKQMGAEDTAQSDKVTQFKAILEAGGPSALLAQFDSGNIATSMLNSPIKQYLAG